MDVEVQGTKPLPQEEKPPGAKANVGEKPDPKTSYLETIIHLFKGNVGPGLFAMGDAFKHGGIAVATILTILIAIVCVHCQHLLVSCSGRMRQLRDDGIWYDYADTVEQCFQNGPLKLRKYANLMRTLVNIFICVTQLGFCCIYFVFISTNVVQILNYHDVHLSVRTIMWLAFVPVLVTSLITNLKYLTPVSLLASIFMLYGVICTLYFALKDGLPDIKDRALYTNSSSLALYFGTAIFAFEGIALVLPLKNAMHKPKWFEHTFGVLNIGMIFVTFLFMFSGGIGYLKWGNDVGGSLTLNLGDTILAQSVKILVSGGVLFGYPLQFFVAIQIMWPTIKRIFGITGRAIFLELIFRTVMVLITMAIAQIVPELGLFISLIGALCSTALALVFPPLIDLITRDKDNKGPGPLIFLKNFIILTVALLGFVTGSYESIKQMYESFSRTSNDSGSS